MHGKIEPDFCEAKPPVHKTFRVPEHEEISEKDIEKMAAQDVADKEEEEEEEGEEKTAKELDDEIKRKKERQVFGIGKELKMELSSRVLLLQYKQN